MIAQLRTVLILLVLGGVMIVLGRVLGGLTAPEGPISEKEVDRLIKNLDEPVGKRIDSANSRAMAGLAVPATAAAHWPTVLDQIRLARTFGVHTFVFEVDLPWQEGAWASLDRLAEAVAAVDGAEIWLALDLNPTSEWLEAHPEQMSTVRTEGAAYPSVGSSEWRNSGSTALYRASRALKEMHPGLRISGVILRGLDEGRWYRHVAHDRSTTNTAAFRAWLERYYETPQALSEAWSVALESFEQVETPQVPSEWPGAFFLGTEGRPYVDYLDYLNETTAGVILFFADCAREAFGEDLRVFAQYGSAFDLPRPDHSQWALGTALSGSLDGIALGVHRSDRSLGDVGGPSGPSTVAGVRGKQWLLLDDTRTGIGWNASANGLFKPAGFEMRTLAPIYDRNLLSAAMERGAVLWSDSRGLGNFLDESLWEYFVSRVPVVDELQHARSGDARTLLVVLDEDSMRYVADGDRVGEHLLNATRRAVAQSGVSYGYVLLDDLLSGGAPEARIFVFPNLFHVEPSTRDALHAYFAEHGAAAVWLYAPGAVGSADPAAAVAATSKVAVGMADAPSSPRSSYALTGNWVRENEEFGETASWYPLFFIADEDADAIARYTSTNDPSVAVKFMDEGWASVLVAAPAITTELLREILDILDHPPVIRNTGNSHHESFVMRKNHVLVHAGDQGDRMFNFELPHDVADLLNEEVGWPDKQILQLPMRAGDTRLLKLTPSAPISGEMVGEPEVSANDAVDPKEDSRKKVTQQP